MVAHYRPEASACISEKVLGFGRKLPEDSDRSGEPTPCSGETTFGRGQGQLLPQLSNLAPR